MLRPFPGLNKVVVTLLGTMVLGAATLRGMPLTPVPPLLEQAYARGLARGGRLLVVSVADQQLALLTAGASPRLYVVSTSKRGLGSLQDSEGTPPGWHRITDWIGAQARPGQAFVSRQTIRDVLPPDAWRSDAGEDLILTRILWLDGLEPGINRGANRDSRSRYIYLHGTNQEHLLGRPASHGCIRLANRDIMELFDLTVGHHTYCWITDQSLAGLYE